MTSTFLPLHINVRSKLWRPLALSPEVTMTSNFDCDLLVPTNNYGVIVSLKFQSSIFIAPASLDSRSLDPLTSLLLKNPWGPRYKIKHLDVGLGRENGVHQLALRGNLYRFFRASSLPRAPTPEKVYKGYGSVWISTHFFEVYWEFNMVSKELHIILDSN